MQNFHLNSCCKPFWGSVNSLMYVYKQTKPLQSMTWTSRPLLGSGHPGSLSSVKLDDQIVCTTWFYKKQGLNYWFKVYIIRNLGTLELAKTMMLFSHWSPLKVESSSFYPRCTEKETVTASASSKMSPGSEPWSFHRFLWQTNANLCGLSTCPNSQKNWSSNLVML